MQNQQYSRLDKISETIKRKLSELLVTKCSDPRIGMLVINKVIVSPDLSLARVMFSTLESNDSNIKETLAGLRSASGFFRSEIAKLSSLKRFPRLHFVHDEKSVKGEIVRGMIDSMYPVGVVDEVS